MLTNCGIIVLLLFSATDLVTIEKRTIKVS